MSRFRVAETRPIKHHEQDRVDFCGPACAQMIIASLTPRQDGPANAGTPIIDQGTLMAMRPVAGTAWATLPNDLVAMLNAHAGQIAPNKHWYIASTAPHLQHELLAEAAVSMNLHGTPAVIVTGPADHWCVITGINLVNSGATLFLDNPDSIVSRFGQPPHLVADPCQHHSVAVGANIVTKLVRVDRRPFGGLDLTVQPVRGVANDSSGYDGKAIAIIYGNPRIDDSTEFARLSQLFAIAMETDRGDEIDFLQILPQGETKWMDRLRALLEELVDEQELIEFGRKLTLVSPPRLVRRLDDGDGNAGGVQDAYVIVAAAAEDGAVVVAFDKRGRGLLLDSQWVIAGSDVNLRFLEKQAVDPLFWMPTKYTTSPTEPFTIRNVDGRRMAKRLSDDFEFELPIQR